MGNCVSPMHVANSDDYLSPPESPPEPLAVATTEVKITLTRRQLERLLEQVEHGGKLTPQLLLDAVAASSGAIRESAAEGWRPALPSIPETE